MLYHSVIDEKKMRAEKLPIYAYYSRIEICATK